MSVDPTELVNQTKSIKSINVHEAKTNLSRILVQVEGGQEFLIARVGKAIARLSPVAPTHAELEGQFGAGGVFPQEYAAF